MNPLMNLRTFVRGGFLTAEGPTTIVRRQPDGIEVLGTWTPAPRSAPDALPLDDGGALGRTGASDERPDPSVVAAGLVEGPSPAAVTPTPREAQAARDKVLARVRSGK
jgi:hypothetical protein